MQNAYLRYVRYCSEVLHWIKFRISVGSNVDLLLTGQHLYYGFLKVIISFYASSTLIMCKHVLANSCDASGCLYLSFKAEFILVPCQIYSLFKILGYSMTEKMKS